MIGRLNGHFNDYFNAGGTFTMPRNNIREAYEAFMIYGDMSKAPYATKAMQEIPDFRSSTPHTSTPVFQHTPVTLSRRVPPPSGRHASTTPTIPRILSTRSHAGSLLPAMIPRWRKTAAREIEEVARAGKR